MASVCLAVLVVAVAALGPAAVFVRRLRLRPAEMLVASVGLSLLALYAVSWAIYLAKVPVGAHLAVAASFLVLLAASFPTLKALVFSREVRRMLAAWGVYSLYAVGLLALVRSHSGGGWAGDWYEHYERALFFLGREPLDVRFIGEWTLSARPPLMNLLEGHVLAVAGESYPAYQVASTLFSALLILPVLLLARLFTRSPGRIALVLALFLLNPMIVENVTYSWTKPFAAFYAVAGVAFYAAGVTLRSRSRVVLGFVFAAAGTLAHYSAAPYLLFVAGWEAVRAWRGGAPVRREILAAAGAAGLVLASWFAWSLTSSVPWTGARSSRRARWGRSATARFSSTRRTSSSGWGRAARSSRSGRAAASGSARSGSPSSPSRPLPGSPSQRRSRASASPTSVFRGCSRPASRGRRRGGTSSRPGSGAPPACSGRSTSRSGSRSRSGCRPFPSARSGRFPSTGRPGRRAG